MKELRYIFLVLLIPLFASGCASTGGGSLGLNQCGVIGTGLGGITGALIAEKAIAGVIPGALVGAVLGQMICSQDADGDGVLDNVDQCPDTPKDAVVNEAGCQDTDRDGVADSADKCPNTPEGIPVDEDGCPPDADGDGVADLNDECPNTLPGTRVKDNGCAKCGQLLASVPSVNFDFNKANIRPDATNVLSQVAKALQNTETTIRVEGYTDSVGSDKYNLTLSNKRAKVVSDYLKSRGVSADNVVAVVGKGESSPVASNETPAGREQNRRVEIITDCAVR
uniref:OmpA-OmpF porin, OOP family n=1 Tax=Candidatus Kentrum sp. DK TaxID=2126562 RepID=A0A450S1E4_9GAMM|nr:MAG: OmpA-OmpF porin, OOP family [Candidatus Kentron sp. DK]VFJ45481.1 MAG: OmpA-OmpF porin, OOP family [Candidatus Kentron sp. DK]